MLGKILPILPDEPVLVSASQISTFRLCQRKWGFQTLHGLRTETAATKIGTEVHNIREMYLKSGQPIDQSTTAGQIAATGIHELDHVSQTAEIEAYFERPLSKSLRLRGYIDVLDRDNGEIIDHKTTGDLKWALTEAGLQKDVQANVYADFLLNEGFDEVTLRWLYVTRKKPYRSSPRSAKFSFADTDRLAFVGGLQQTAEQIENIRRYPLFDVNDLPENSDSCGAYGGCPFSGRECSASVFSQLNNGGNMSDFKDRLAAFKAKQAAKPDQANPEPVTPTEPAVPEETEETPKKRGRPLGSKNKLDSSEIVAELKGIRAELERQNELAEQQLEAFLAVNGG